MADENKKSIIKSELNEITDNLLYDNFIYRKFPINIITTYGLNSSGTTSTVYCKIKLGINGEIIQTLQSVYFTGSVQIVNLDDRTLNANTLASSLVGQSFMTDVSNTGTTAATTTGIQTDLYPPVHIGDFKKNFRFGGVCYLPPENMGGLFYEYNGTQTAALRGGFFYNIKNSNIIIKGFIFGAVSNASILTQMTQVFNDEREVFLYAKLPLFQSVTYTYE